MSKPCDVWRDPRRGRCGIREKCQRDSSRARFGRWLSSARGPFDVIPSQFARLKTSSRPVGPSRRWAAEAGYRPIDQTKWMTATSDTRTVERSRDSGTSLSPRLAHPVPGTARPIFSPAHVHPSARRRPGTGNKGRVLACHAWISAKNAAEMSRRRCRARSHRRLRLANEQMIPDSDQISRPKENLYAAR